MSVKLTKKVEVVKLVHKDAQRPNIIRATKNVTRFLDQGYETGSDPYFDQQTMEFSEKEVPARLADGWAHPAVESPSLLFKEPEE